MTDFLDTVRATAQKHRMFPQGSRVLVGVSGGPDSLALFTALVALRQEKRLTLRAVYVDHRLRPSATPREKQLVRKLGKLWGVPVHVIERSVRRKGGVSPEEAAREVRYEALIRLARANRCQAIALGHTWDDQAETVLMRLLRGAGPRGLAGIPPVREISTLRSGESGNKRKIRIIRPLIGCSRQQVQAYLKVHQIRPLQDRTNRSSRFLRNRLRNQLIPFLEKNYNPNLRNHLNTLAEILRADLDWLQVQVRRQFREVARVRSDKVRLDQNRTRSLPVSLRRGLLRLAVERLQGSVQGFGSDHWQALDRLLLNGGQGAQDFPHGFRAECRDGQLLLTRRRT